MADPRERVPRSSHPRAHRRSEAGDLRVPRRRRRHLPARHPGGRQRVDARDQLAQRRVAGCERCRTSSAARRWATRASWSTTSTPRTSAASIVGTPCDAPLRIRQLRRRHVGVADDATIYIGPARDYIARDVAADIVALLSSGATLHERDARARRRSRPTARAGRRRRPRQRNDDGRTVRDALHDAGVPVVLTGTSSVFLSAAARDWLTFLTALEQPNRAGLARSAALTTFVGWTAEQLAGDEAAFDDLSVRLREVAEVLSRRGVAALFEAVDGDVRTDQPRARPTERRARAHRPAACRAGAA